MTCKLLTLAYCCKTTVPLGSGTAAHAQHLVGLYLSEMIRHIMKSLEFQQLERVCPTFFMPWEMWRQFATNSIYGHPIVRKKKKSHTTFETTREIGCFICLVFFFFLKWDLYLITLDLTAKDKGFRQMTRLHFITSFWPGNNSSNINQAQITVMNTSIKWWQCYPRKTCTTSSSIHGWPQNHSFHQQQHAMTHQISCPLLLWSFWLHSDVKRGIK